MPLSNLITGNSFIPFGTLSQIEAMEAAGHDSFTGTGNVFRNAVNCMHIAATSSSSGNICHLPPLLQVSCLVLSHLQMNLRLLQSAVTGHLTRF
jgi:hypothetical protein